MSYRRKGFLLRSVDYGESHLIFDFLDSTGSLQSFLARGARASKKRFGGGVLDPLQYIELTYEKKSEESFPLLLEARLINAFEGIRSNYDKILWGARVLKLCRFYSKEGLEEPELFHLLGNSMKVMESADEPETIYWHFLARLMAQQGDLERTEKLGGLLASPIGEIQLEAKKRENLSKVLRRQFELLFHKKLEDLF